MPKAIIIGGGICGLTTAIALAQVGVEVSVFERSEELREIGAGLTLWANGVYALSKIFLHEGIINEGQVTTNFNFKNSQGRELGRVDIRDIEDSMGVPSISIHRGRLMTALLAHINADKELKKSIHLNHEFEGYTQNDELVAAHFSNGYSEAGDILLGCDGFHSRVRSFMLEEDEPRYSGYTCWRGVAAASGLVEPGSITHYMARGAQLGILDTGHGNVCWYATANVPSHIKEDFEDRKLDVISRFARWAPPVPALLELTESRAYLKNDIYDRDPQSHWIDDRVLLMGDAAHPTTPNLGQGACQAIEDAVVLSGCVSKVLSVLKHSPNASFHEDSFEAFCRLRQERTSKIVLASRKAGEISQMDNPFMCIMRDIVFEIMAKSNNLSDFENAVCHKV